MKNKDKRVELECLWLFGEDIRALDLIGEIQSRLTSIPKEHVEDVCCEFYVENDEVGINFYYTVEATKGELLQKLMRQKKKVLEQLEVLEAQINAL